MSGHRVEWKHDRDSVYGVVRCGNGEGADCRLACASGCEEWSDVERTSDGAFHAVINSAGEEIFSHTMKDQGYCNIVEFIDQSGVAECYAGPSPAYVRSGLIKVAWTGDDYEWSYA